MNSSGISGTIFEIRELCFEDGPGPRTTLFFKGCPLRCLWCHNPEGWNSEPQRFVLNEECLHCGICRKVCPSPEHCIACGRCAAVCPKQRYRLCGRTMSVADIAERVLKDRDFLMRSGGGVTFSGGEPLLQMDFLLALVRALRPLSIAVESCGYASCENYRTMLECVDFVFQDLKCMDEALHRKLTGVSNALILKNTALLLKSGVPSVIRIPIIPGVNDIPAELEAAAEFLSDLPRGSLQEIQLLPYHGAGAIKYRQLAMDYPLEGLPENYEVPEEFQAIFEKKRLRCRRKKVLGTVKK